VGEENHGWDVAMSALGSERVMWSGDIKLRFEQLVDYLHEENRYKHIQSEKPWLLDKLAEFETRLHIGRLLSYKAAASGDKGLVSFDEGPVSKIHITELRRQLFDTAMKILGPYGQLTTDSKWAPLNGWVPRELLDSCRWTIVGGTIEVHRLIIALRGLGLPRK